MSISTTLRAEQRKVEKILKFTESKLERFDKVDLINIIIELTNATIMINERLCEVENSVDYLMYPEDYR